MSRWTRSVLPRAVLVTLGWVLIVGVAASQSPDQPSEQPQKQRARPMEEPASEEKAVPVNAETAAVAPNRATVGGVPGGVVMVNQLPTSPRPEPGLVRSHIQGEMEQHQTYQPGQEWIPLVPKQTPEPQFPTLLGEPAPGAEGTPAAPGDFVRQWTALSDTGWIPPDTIHAVGPGHIVEAVNSGFAIYTKLGTQVQGYTTFQSFLNKPAGWAGFMFDPRVVYDPDHDKFVMLALGRDDTAVRSYFWLAVSQTSDPTQGWWRWRFDATDTSGSSTAWLDYAGVGADRWGVYVTGNLFYFSGGFRGSRLHSINPDIFNGGATNGWVWIDLEWPSGSNAFAMQPAQPHTVNSAAEMFFVNTFSGSGSSVLLWRLSGDRTSSPSLTRVSIGTATYNAIGGNVDQPGSGVDIDGGDARVMNAVYVNRRVFFTLTDDVNNDGSASGWLTVKLDTNTNTNEWQHLLWSGTGRYYFYPAVTVQGSNNAGHVAVFGSWTRTDPPQFASGLYKIYENQPTDATGPFVNAVSGLAAYVALDSNGRNRWGDYSGAGYDWECGHAWGSVESADINNNWRTTVLAREFDNEGACPLIDVLVPNGGEVWKAGTTQTIRWARGGLTPTNDVYIRFDNGTTITQIAGPLSPSSSSFAWTVPGTRTSQARIFVGSWTGLAYEASDWSDATFRITAPDLRVINPGVSQTLMLPSSSFVARATVNNQGDTSSASTTLRYYVSTNSTISIGDTQIGTDPVGALAAGGSSVVSETVNAPSTPGIYWVGACVDAVSGESSTTNQCSTGVQIRVELPDLIVPSFVAPTSAQVGAMFNVSTTVRNDGPITAGASQLGISLSPNSACTSAVTLGTRSIPSLAAFASSSGPTAVTIPASTPTGPRYICAVADRLNAVTESNEGNNTASRLINIQPVPPPEVNLKINGDDPAYPLFVTTPGPIKLTIDMTSGTTAVDHYYAIIFGGTVFWVDPGGNLVLTPVPLATFTPVALTDYVLLDADYSAYPGFWGFAWIMLDAGAVVDSDVVLANVTP